MRKKKRMVMGIMIIVAAIVVCVTVVSQSPRWSEKSFEAIVQETVTQPDGEIRLVIERTTEVYGSPVNSLGISGDTKLLGKDGEELSIDDFQQGNADRAYGRVCRDHAENEQPGKPEVGF